MYYERNRTLLHSTAVTGVRYYKMASQTEQDITVTATIKVATFIYSSHTAAGVVKIQ